MYKRQERDAKTAPLRYRIVSYVSAQQGVHCGHGIIKGGLSFPSNVAMPLDDCDDLLEAAPAIEEESSAVTSRTSTQPLLRTLDGDESCGGSAHTKTKFFKSVKVDEGLRSGKPGVAYGAKSESKWKREGLPSRISHTKLWYGPVGERWRATVPLGGSAEEARHAALRLRKEVDRAECLSLIHI